MQPKIEVGILGATGMVGQQFAKFLQGHPWFEITWLGASDRSAGKTYRDATSWRLDGAMPANVAGLQVQECKPAAGAAQGAEALLSRLVAGGVSSAAQA